MQSKFQDIHHLVGPEQFVLYLILLDYLGLANQIAQSGALSETIPVNFEKFRYAMYDTGVWPIVNHSLESIVVPCTDLNDDSIAALTKESSDNQRVNFARNMFITKQIEEIGEAFNSQNIDWILLKGGASLLTQLWKSDGDRHLSDLDILIRQEHSTQALSALTSLGYDYNKEELKGYSDHHHLPQLTHTSRSKAVIELHTKAGIPRCDADLPLTELFENRIDIKSNRVNCYILSPECQIKLAKLHGSQQLKYRSKMYLPFKDLMELYLLEKKYPVASSGPLICNDFMMRFFVNQYQLFLGDSLNSPSDQSFKLPTIQHFLLRKIVPDNYVVDLNKMDAANNPARILISFLNDAPAQKFDRIIRRMGFRKSET